MFKARHVYETHGFYRVSSQDKPEWGEFFRRYTANGMSARCNVSMMPIPCSGQMLGMA